MPIKSSANLSPLHRGKVESNDAGDGAAGDGGWRNRKGKGGGGGGGGGGGRVVDPEVMAAASERFKAEEETRNAASAADPQSPEGLMQAVRDKLPILKIREDLTKALEDSPVVVVSGGTGSGKSTQCPQYILGRAHSLFTHHVCEARPPYPQLVCF